MYHHIGEEIQVVGVYRHHTFHPVKFKWRQREILITAITLQANHRDGGIKKRFYSVVAGKDVYRLDFNRDSETWVLEEIWIE